MGLSDKYKHLNLADKYRHLDQSKKIEPMAQEIPETQEPGYLESGLRGVEQGLTFGFGDELNAALEALTSDKSYQQAVEESRQKFKEAEEANPWTSTGGTLVGSLIPAGLVSKGVGAGARALQAIAGAGEAVPLVSKLASPASKLAGLVAEGAAGEGGALSMGAAGTAEGGVFGGLTGAGSAENVEEIPERVKEEAKTGALLGGAGGALFGTGKYAKDKIMDTDIGQDIARSWKLGTEKGINYLSKLQKDLFQEQLPENVEKSVGTVTKGWTETHKNKINALENFEGGNFNLNPSVVETVEKQLPQIETRTANPGQIQKFKADLEGSSEELSKIQEKLNNYPLSDELGLKPDQKTKPGLIRRVIDYAKSFQSKEASVAPTKVLKESSAQRIKELEDIAGKIVENGSVGGTISSDAIRELKEVTAKEIAEHPILNDQEMAKWYADYNKLGTKQQAELLEAYPEMAENIKSLEDLRESMRTFSNLEKSSTDKGNNAKVLQEVGKTISLIKKYGIEEVLQANPKATKTFELAENELKKYLQDYNINLTPEQFEILKNDKTLLNDIKERDFIIKKRYEDTKHLAAEQNKVITETINKNDFKGTKQQDLENLEVFAEKLKELKADFNDLKDISPDQAEEFFKRVRSIEERLSPSKYIGDIKEDSPRTFKAFSDFKREVTNALSEGGGTVVNPVDEFGNLLPAKKISSSPDDYGNLPTSTRFGEYAKKEQLYGHLLELLTGEREGLLGSPAEITKKIKAAFNMAKDTSGMGSTFDFKKATEVAKKIGNPEILDALENLKYQHELKGGFQSGEHRFMHNKFSELFTKGVTSAVAAETAGARKFVGNVASKVPSPGDLFKPEVAEKLAQRSPTLGKMLSRISDTNTTEAKKRAYQNILMNNPTVRQILTERSGE